MTAAATPSFFRTGQTVCSGQGDLFLGKYLFDAWDTIRTLQNQSEADLFFTTQTYAEKQARKVCGGCPVRRECAAWAMQNEEAGFWGGMTEDELQAQRNKTGQKVQVMDTGVLLGAEVHIREAGRGKRGLVPDEIMDLYAGKHYSTEELAAMVGCASRTITRRRKNPGPVNRDAAASNGLARIDPAEGNGTPAGSDRGRTGTAKTRRSPRRAPDRREALGQMRPEQNHPAKEAQYDVLADGQWHDRLELVTVGMEHVLAGDALVKGHSTHPGRVISDEKASQSGARAISNNYLHVALRDGRIEREGIRDTARYRFCPEALEQWREYRAENPAPEHIRPVPAVVPAGPADTRPAGWDRAAQSVPAYPSDSPRQPGRLTAAGAQMSV